MPEAFVDTSGWASFFLRNERFHDLAASFMREWSRDGTRIVTTNYVLAELVALFTRPLRVPRPEQVKIIETIKSTSWLIFVHVDATVDAEAWALLRARSDKEWSLVDCASFVLMTRRHITAALTTDRHFEQAGFTRLLK